MATKINKDNVTETIKATGATLVEKVKELLHEGNIRKVSVTNKEGKTVASFPLTFGVIGAIIIPPLTVIALVIGFANDCSIIVEKEQEEKKPAKGKK